MTEAALPGASWHPERANATEVSASYVAAILAAVANHPLTPPRLTGTP